ncbi:MAG: DNA primase small subunit domain-containing protein [Conexivisphaerales archaeon]
MDVQTKQFLQNEFRKYYFSRTAEVEIPDNPSAREFGYLTFDGVMVRHIGCEDEGEVKALILKEVPRGFFASVAKYENPSLPIEEKGWTQSDLVFDIDAGDLGLKCIAEHDFYLCQSCYTPYKVKVDECNACRSKSVVEVKWVCKECIEATEAESEKLQQILEADFGIPSSKIRRYFSGHRGFHVHVRDSGYETLDQNARLEIVEYLSGIGLLPKHFGFSARWASYDSDKLPLEREPGWRGRVARRIIELTSITDSKQAFAAYYAKNRDKIKESMESVLQSVAVRVDRAVTIDLHRIFRMPGTLHDKSGLIKKLFRENDDPLATAVGLGSFPVEAWVAYSPVFSLKGESFGPYRNETTKLPAYAAAFLAMKGLARVKRRIDE